MASPPPRHTRRDDPPYPITLDFHASSTSVAFEIVMRSDDDLLPSNFDAKRKENEASFIFFTGSPPFRRKEEGLVSFTYVAFGFDTKWRPSSSPVPLDFDRRVRDWPRLDLLHCKTPAPCYTARGQKPYSGLSQCPHGTVPSAVPVCQPVGHGSGGPMSMPGPPSAKRFIMIVHHH